jgi:uridine kinase
MTVTTENSPLAGVAEEELLSALVSGEGEEERGIEHPLLLAALMRRRHERGNGILDHPIILAALLRRHRGEEEEHGIEHPLLLAALMRRRHEHGNGILDHPIILAALARRHRGEREGGFGGPALAAALLGRR